MNALKPAVACLLLLALCSCSPKRGPRTPAAGPGASISIRFTDITQAAGINFTHNNGAFGAKLLPETMGAGMAFLDYDNDGDQDLFVVNGRDWTDAEIEAFKTGSGADMAASLPPRLALKGGTCHLYENNGNGAFIDVTAGSGFDELPLYGMGATVGDYDNDGDPDLYVTGVGRNYLFRNNGPGQFQEVARAAGVVDRGWSSSAAFLDYDKDGRLDLFVCHYVVWSPAGDIFNTVDGKTKAYTTPEQYVGEACRLYRNLGGGRFRDVSVPAGISVRRGPGEGAGKPLLGKSLGVAISDFDGDSWPDIAVANDTEPNFLFRNNARGAFDEIGGQAGIALAETGAVRAAMGVDAGDFDGSGRDSLLFANFSNQMLGLYRNHGGRAFVDIAADSELGTASRPFLGFGACFVDVDNDGMLDIFTANGHLDRDIELIQEDVKFMQRPLLFWNRGKGEFAEVGTRVGEAFARPLIGRGAAYADIDLDGDVDLAITTNNGPLTLFRNDGGSRNNSIRLILQGARGNRSAVGAVVEVKVGAEVVRRTIRSGSSYLSQSELPLTIGLGARQQADSLTVTWPSGAKRNVESLSAGQIITITESAEAPVTTQPFLR